MSAGVELPPAYRAVRSEIGRSRARWLVTGAAGFIGSHLVQALLDLDQAVVGVDDFSTGRRHNLALVEAAVGTTKWSRFELIEGDIRVPRTCLDATRGVRFVLHQAALGSVPRSIEDPVSTHDVNAGGTLRLLLAAVENGIERFVYASSSAVYGDHPALPKREDVLGAPLSPYAASKLAAEAYASAIAATQRIAIIGLRYFNVFGPRQNPDGPYAAVIPRWIDALRRGEPVEIFGDGETTRDFCFVADVVQANLLAAAAEVDADHRVYNVAQGERTSLVTLFRMLRGRVDHPASPEPVFRDFRPGDVRHSQADISRARRELGFAPTQGVEPGLDETVRSYRI